MQRPDEIDRQNIVALVAAAAAILAGVGLICLTVLH